MSYNTEKIAILLATYNGDKYLAEQLDSLLAQSYQDWVCYAHDDGSTDDTPKILASYSQKYPNNFIVVEGPATGGAKNNFIYLFNQVEAPYYMCCDQDDVWLPEKIAITFDAMKKVEDAEKPCIAHTDLTVADEKLQTIAESMNSYQNLRCHISSFSLLWFFNNVTGCAMMANRVLREILIKQKDTTHIIMHDWWAALIASKYGHITFVPQATILYRQHGDNSVGSHKFGLTFIWSKREEYFNIIKLRINQRRLFFKTYK